VVNLSIPVFNVLALLHDVISKQEILMEQQRNIIRIVQDLKANNIREITEAQNQGPKWFPIEDSIGGR